MSDAVKIFKFDYESIRSTCRINWITPRLKYGIIVPSSCYSDSKLALDLASSIYVAVAAIDTPGIHLRDDLENNLRCSGPIDKNVPYILYINAKGHVDGWDDSNTLELLIAEDCLIPATRGPLCEYYADE